MVVTPQGEKKNDKDDAKPSSGAVSLHIVSKLMIGITGDDLAMSGGRDVMYSASFGSFEGVGELSTQSRHLSGNSRCIAKDLHSINQWKQPVRWNSLTLIQSMGRWIES